MGFDAKQQRKLNNYHQKNIPVEVINCEVKSSKYGEGYEMMLKGGTHIKESPKKSKQLTISGGSEHDVRISVPFTRDTTRAHAHSARTQCANKFFGIVTCSKHWLSKLRLCQRLYMRLGRER